MSRTRTNPLLPILQEARSYARPLTKKMKGMGIAGLNDVSRALGSDLRLTEPVANQWTRILRRSRATVSDLPPADGRRILFATGYGFSAAMLAGESIIATALRLRGHAVLSLKCDAGLPACEWNRFGNHRPSAAPFAPPSSERTALDRCRVCTEAIDGSYGRLPVESLSLRRYARPGDLERAAATVDAVPYERYQEMTYRGVNVGEHAFSSTLRALLRGTLGDDPETRWQFRRYLVSAVLLTELGERMLDAERPDVLVAVHGVYLVHGTLSELARKRGVEVVVYGHPYRRGTIWLSRDDTYHRTLVHESNALWEDIDLSGERGRVVDEYLASRRFGARDWVTFNTDPVEDREVLVRELRLDPERPIVSLYTNVLWDAQIYHGYTAFSSMLEWLFETVRFFADRPEVQLVVRVHPAEARAAMLSRQPILAELERAFPQLPGNVRLIPPQSRLSSYTLAELSDAALIYGTKMGVEIAALGVPVIIAGEAFHRGKGYTYDVESREDYFRLLERIPQLPRNDARTVERARRYAFYFFFRRMIDFPLFSVSEAVQMSDVRLEFEDLDALRPGRSGSLDFICDAIADGTTPFAYESSEYADADAV